MSRFCCDRTWGDPNTPLNLPQYTLETDPQNPKLYTRENPTLYTPENLKLYTPENLLCLLGRVQGWLREV